MRIITFTLLAGMLALAPLSHGAGLLERLGLRKSKTTNSPVTSQMIGSLSHDQMVSGLKEALGQGMQQAVASLGRPDGFLHDPSVRIPMPENLQRVEKALRALRQDDLADEFVTTMNRAAEQAVPEGAAVLGQALKQMSFADARTILTGTNNAATEYFRRTSETNLHARFLPIVQAATEQAGVTRSYKQMVDQAGGAFGGLGGRLWGEKALDLDSYITARTLDGLFLKIAEQEKQIRENPVARTTDLLQKVFGAVNP
jgi:hypothetical protein